MKHLKIMIFGFAMQAQCGLAADEWLGLDIEPPVLIGFDLAQEDSGDLSHSFNLSLPLGLKAGYQGYYGNTKLSDGEQEFDSLALATMVWFQLSELIDIEVQHFFEGNDRELEKETLGIAVGLTQGNWQFRLQLEAGELLIYTRDDIADFLNTLIPDRFASDVVAPGLALGWQDEPWYWQLSYQRYEYEEDLSRLDRSDFVQFIVKSSALAQSSLLISEYSSLLVGHADFENDYSIIIAQERSAIDQNYYDSLVLSWQHWASESVGYLLAATIPEQSDHIELTLGLRWAL